MPQPSQGKIAIRMESDIVLVRKAVRNAAKTLRFSVTDVTRIVTAASELARNVYHYAQTGEVLWSTLEMDGRTGLKLEFVDKGPGIENVDMAMEMGYTTRGGLGLGLPGAKRLMDDMQVVSCSGEGTSIAVTKWL